MKFAIRHLLIFVSNVLGGDINIMYFVDTSEEYMILAILLLISILIKKVFNGKYVYYKFLYKRDVGDKNARH
ncbi:hypothetical protein CWR41_00365 [Cedecea lapagei]|nr:hypothetical protein CWR41_00365 [Cedecea lapagei]